MDDKEITLPYNLLAEKIVLGSIINYSDSINFVSQILTVETFYLPKHQIIYKAALVLNSDSKTVDLVTLVTWLQDNNLLEQIGGIETLNRLCEKIVSFVNLNEYTELIKDKYIRRLLINFGDEIIELGYQTNLPLEKIFNKIEKKIFALNQKNIDNNLATTAEILTDIVSQLHQQDKSLYFSGYSCRFFDLDAMTQGFQKSDLIIIAGRPSMGKTAFSLNIALDICFKYNSPIIFFSLEMTKQQLVYRLLAIETEIPTSRLKLNNLREDEWPKLNTALKKLSSLPFYIDDTPNISISEIHFKIQKIKSQLGNIGLIIIDYLQLLESIKKTENRVQEISQITRNLKVFAREFNIPIIVLSQLSRNVESRNNKRPILSDLRESGCIALKEKNVNKNGNFLEQFKLHSLMNCKLIKTINYKLHFTGIKPIYFINSNSGLFILTTSNHKILSENYWLRVDKIKKKYTIKINLSVYLKKKFLKSILNEKINKIKYKNLKKVYDFEIVKSKTFLKNGFILHNSIEQDADIVLMLYRENYYNEQTNDKNLAEIIIAKHRNGPTGTIKLDFDCYLTKFFNKS